MEAPSKNFRARGKLGSAVFLKVQKEVGGGARLRWWGGGASPHSSESTLQSLHRALEFFFFFCGRSQGAWIDKTHLHCSEMADWSDLKRKIPFTSLQYNLLSHILAEKGRKEKKKTACFSLKWGIDGQNCNNDVLVFRLIAASLNSL